MKTSLRTKISVFFYFLLTVGCNSLKYVPKGDYLLVDNNVIINSKQLKFKPQRENSTKTSDEIFKYIERPPNRKSLFGIPVGIHVYNIADSIPSKDFDNWVKKRIHRKRNLNQILSEKQLGRLRHSYIKTNKWLKKIGEPPVILDIEDVRKTLRKFKSYENSVGYFNSKIRYEIDSLSNQKAKVRYYIETKKPYIINQITSEIESPLVDSIYHKGIVNTLIKKGDVYSLKTLEKESNRITRLCRNSGLYTFQKKAISFEIYMDTLSRKDNKMDMKIIIPNQILRKGDSTSRIPYKAYFINDVNIYIGNNKYYNDSIRQNNMNIYFKDKLTLNPKVLSNGVFIKEGGLYKDKDREDTYRYFNDFSTLKYTTIDFKNILESDTLFHANVHIYPKSKFSLKINTNISNSAIQDFGFSISPSLTIRNIFRRGEYLELLPRGSIGFQNQIGGVGTKIISEYGGGINFYIPKILFPLNTKKFIRKNVKPQTQISVGTSFQKNIGLDRQSIKASIRYKWSSSPKTSYVVKPLGVEYIQNINTSKFYNIYSATYTTVNKLAKANYDLVSSEYINDNGNLTIPLGADRFLLDLSNANRGDDTKTANNILFRKNRLTENSIILGSRFTRIFNTRESLNDNNFFRLVTHAEFSGSLLTALSDVLSLKKDKDGRYLINNIPYSQYVKLDVDFSKYFNLGYDNIIVFHSMVGLTVPFGNSNTIPFLKSYFAGGTNDNRGWLAYSLGPGRNDALLDFNEGNLKIVTNLEYRFSFIGDLRGALFIDAGNVWNVWDSTQNEKAKFLGFESLIDIAISSGVGLRYNLNFLILRLDVGFKTYNPIYPLNKRWFSEFNFSDSVLNIAINYPF